jgi:ribonuclease BN (tRNA processing enzyme)
MQASLQFLGAGAPDGGAKTIMLTIDGHRYLFNCSPGTQRCSLQHGIKFSRIEVIFFTDLSWSSIGGFKGMASTLSDLETPLVQRVKVVGPRGLQELVDASYPFLKRSLPFLDIVEQPDYFQDALIKVTPLLRDAVWVGFLVEGPRVPGSFDAMKAKSLGLKPGPAYKILLDGHSVSLPDGSVIWPDDVVAPSKPFPRIAILEQDLDIDCDIKISYVPANAALLVPCLSWEPIFVDSIQIEQVLSKKCPHLHSPLYYRYNEVSVVRPMDEHVLFPTPQLARLSGLPAPPSDFDVPPLENVIVTLGTGAAMPGKYRNVSATLFSTRSIKGIFDCGEATLGQLMRKYGPRYVEIIWSLDFIAISHLHADHHLGLLDLFNHDTSTRLHVILPRGVLHFVQVYQKINGTRFSEHVVFHELEEASEFPIKDDYVLRKIQVDHCEGACAFLLMQSNVKVCLFSGDTRPCQGIIDEGCNVRVLIHEATMPDELQVEAELRKHCTISEAISVAEQLGPQLTVLTHFSQRFGKELPLLHPGIIMASDFMHVQLDRPSSDDDNRHQILR